MTFPSTGGSKMRTQVPLGPGSCDDALQTQHRSVRKSMSGCGFVEMPLDFHRGIFLLCAMGRERFKIGKRIRHRFSCKISLADPLRDQVGKAAVWRCGMHVFGQSKSKVADRRIPGTSTTYSPRPRSLMMVSDRSWKCLGFDFFCSIKNASRALGLVAQEGKIPCIAAISTIRSQRLGCDDAAERGNFRTSELTRHRSNWPRS